MTDREHVAARLAFVAGGVNRRLRPRGGELGHIAVSALASVGKLGPIRPGDLARVEGVTAPGVTRLLADLEARGLIQRTADPDDRRAQLVELTAAGVEELAAARLQRTLGALDLIAPMTDAQVAQLVPALDALEAALMPQAVPAR